MLTINHAQKWYNTCQLSCVNIILQKLSTLHTIMHNYNVHQPLEPMCVYISVEDKL